MSQRALVTGATGLLGRQVLRAFEKDGYEVIGTGFSRASPPRIRKVDIQNADDITQLIHEVKPHIVVHCAADRQPDSCTSNPDAARSLNVRASSTLAQLCSSAGIFLIYISTDYVFPGRPGEAPYAATATPSPPNVYGETKLEGEKEVLTHTVDGQAVVLRVPVLYGETDPKDNNKESAVNVIMDALWKANGREGLEQQNGVKMDDWAIRYPTNTEDVARVCVDISKVYTQAVSSQGGSQNGPSRELPRILQFSSEDRMTKYEIMRQFAEIMGLSLENVTADKDGGNPPATNDTPQPVTADDNDTGATTAIGGVNVEVQCAVPLPDNKVCTRSLACKRHSMGAKRAVPGRSAPYDTLLQQWQAARIASQAGPATTSRPYDCHLSTQELKDIGIDVSTVNFVGWWRRYIGIFR